MSRRPPLVDAAGQSRHLRAGHPPPGNNGSGFNLSDPLRRPGVPPGAPYVHRVSTASNWYYPGASSIARAKPRAAECVTENITSAAPSGALGRRYTAHVRGLTPLGSICLRRRCRPGGRRPLSGLGRRHQRRPRRHRRRLHRQWCVLGQSPADRCAGGGSGHLGCSGRGARWTALPRKGHPGHRTVHRRRVGHRNRRADHPILSSRLRHRGPGVAGASFVVSTFLVRWPCRCHHAASIPTTGTDGFVARHGFRVHESRSSTSAASTSRLAGPRRLRRRHPRRRRPAARSVGAEAQFPYAGVVVLARSLDPAGMLEAMRLGITEWLSEPLDGRSRGRLAAGARSVLVPIDARQLGGRRRRQGRRRLHDHRGQPRGRIRGATRDATLLVDMHMAQGNPRSSSGSSPGSLCSMRSRTSTGSTTLFPRPGHPDAVGGRPARLGQPPGPRFNRRAAGPGLLEFVTAAYPWVVIDCPRWDPSVIDALDIDLSP